MASYYGYVKQEENSQINWANVGKGISDMLDKEVQSREAQKKEIDDKSRAIVKTLNEAPQGDFTTANTYILDYSQQAQQAMLELNKLLKSGKMKMSDYVSKRQNLVDGTDNIFATMKDFQAQKAEAMKRLQNRESQSLEGDVWESAQGFGNFTDTKLYINPKDYSVHVGKMVDGQLVQDPNDHTSVIALRNRVKQKYDRLDVDGLLDKQAKSMGKETQVIRTIGDALHLGSITEIMDPTIRGKVGTLGKDGRPIFTKENAAILSDFEKSEQNIINTMLAQPTNISSILTENIVNIDGQKIGFTWDPNDKDKTKILKKTDGYGNTYPDFSGKNGQEQKKLAEDYIRTQFRARLDRDIKMTTVTEPKPEKTETYRPTEAQIMIANGYEMIDGHWTKIGAGGGGVGTITFDKQKEALGKYLDQGIGAVGVGRESSGFDKVIEQQLKTLKFTSSGGTVTAPNGATIKITEKLGDNTTEGHLQRQEEYEKLKKFILDNVMENDLKSKENFPMLYPYLPKGETTTNTGGANRFTKKNK